QTRFGAMLTAVLDDAASPAPAQSTAAAGGGPLRESALDRFVAEHPAARRPLSSYEALRICPADGGDGGAADAALDAQVGPQDEVLVGAAAWQRDDRRRVLRALQRLGPDFAQVASLMPSKTTAQCRYFYYHYRTPAGALLSDVISGASPRKVPAAAQPDALVLPPAPAAASSSAAAPGPPLAGLEQPPAKRARTRSPAGSRSGSGSDDDGDDDDDDDDEMPLAAQLAEELAALQPREGASPMAVVAAGLVLPRPAQSSQLPAPPISATSNPSPHGASAKKSGYSSYWSVLERSAFLHHLARLGQNWLALAEAIGTKTGTQVRNYFRANQEKLGLDAVIVAYERNRAAGTLPPPEAFTPTSARDDAQARKEKRGRKRKGDAQPSPRPGSPDEGSAANSSVPSTAPASITSFPTIGVDGGRAVVLACPPPAPNRSLPTAEPPSLPRLHQWSRLPRDQAAQTTGHVPLHLVSEPTAGMGPRAGVVDRGDSSTPMSQPTPPPVEGLRLPSSSPAAAAVVGPRPMASRPRQMSALHISNLTTGSSTPQEEPRKVSVTKINALLNDDSPGPSHMSSDWFNDPPPADGAEPENADAEDDATGIAALALASMMGAAMQTHPPPPPPLPPPPAVAHQHLRPQPIHQPRPQIRTAAVSAFSP
ncbi:DNA-binding protein snt1, partial [Coemansia nantahalensis]